MTDRLHAFATTLAVSVCALGLWACSGGASEAPQSTRPSAKTPAGQQADQQASAASSYSVKRYVRGANQAVGLTFDNKGRLLYAEKDSGRIIRFANGRKTVLASLNVVNGSEAGLLGLASDSAGRIYAHYTGASAGCPDPTTGSSGGGLEGHCVWRFKPGSSGRLTPDGRVFSSGHPSSADNHVGGGLHFGPDGALYLSIGDLGENDDPDNGPGRAQSLSVPFGKILRLDPAGNNKAASGNPGKCGNAENTAQRDTEDDRIWACGLRNTYQFAFDANGTMWGSESGDSCDEINRVKAAVNYGWQPPRTDCSGSGAGRPVVKLSGTPSGIAVPTARSAGGWRNDVFYCIYTSSELVRYDQRTKRRSRVAKAAGRCSYDLAARGNRLYMSNGQDIFRLSIRR